MSWTGCSLTATKPAIGVICGCCGRPQAARTAAAMIITGIMRDMNSPQLPVSTGPRLGALLPEAAPNPNLSQGQKSPDRHAFTHVLHRWEATHFKGRPYKNRVFTDVLHRRGGSGGNRAVLPEFRDHLL